MRRFFDSSILVPVFYADHPRHTESAKIYLSGTKEDSFCALRSLGEVYAVLTGLPLRPRITGGDGIAIFEADLRSGDASLVDAGGVPFGH